MDAQKAREFFTPKVRTGRNTEHTSFWMNPLNVEFIREASKTTRMPQGVILELIINYYRLTRRKTEYELQGRHLTEYDQRKLENTKYLLRIVPY